MTIDPIRVLIVDDNKDFREGLRDMLNTVPEVDVVGEAMTGHEAIELAVQLQPDVVLMDLQMPGCNGIEAASRIVATSPHIGVLMVTMFEDDDSVFSAMRAGARGYVLKGAPKAEVLRAARAVSNGEAIFSPAIARRMMGFFSARPAAPVFPELTDREREVLHQQVRYRQAPFSQPENRTKPRFEHLHQASGSRSYPSRSTSPRSRTRRGEDLIGINRFRRIVYLPSHGSPPPI
jgi:DNA-binding NarL/FixJ family response regulator